MGLEAAGDLQVCANSSESCGPGPHSCSTAGMALQEKAEGSHKLPQHKGLQATLAHATSFIHCSEKGFEVFTGSGMGFQFQKNAGQWRWQGGFCPSAYLCWIQVETPRSMEEGEVARAHEM